LLRIWIGRYLCNELVEDRLPERVEVLGDHDEGPRAANHVVPVIIIEASRRIGVVGAEIRRILGQNDEAINGYAFGKSFVTRNSDVAAGIIVSIPRNVDRAACGVIWRAGELRYGEIDATTNRSPIREGTGRFDHLGRKILRRDLVMDDGPVDDDLLRPDARPFNEADADLAQGAGANGLDNARIDDGGCVTVTLKLKFLNFWVSICAKHQTKARGGDRPPPRRAT